jgi:hypothetical protein
VVKRGVAAALAVLYAISFAVLCLGTCLTMSSSKPAAHACCPQPGTTVSAPTRDCCAVTAGTLSADAVAVLAAPSIRPADLPRFVAFAGSARNTVPAAAASPPDVLRI